jgi:hypothetical protein
MHSKSTTHCGRSKLPDGQCRQLLKQIMFRFSSQTTSISEQDGSYRYKREGRKSSSGTATRYRLDGPEIESRLGAIFFTPVQTGPGDHPASYTMGTGSFPWVKRPGRGDHPPPSSAEAKETVQLCLYSPSWHSWPVLGWTLTFILGINVTL